MKNHSKRIKQFSPFWLKFLQISVFPLASFCVAMIRFCTALVVHSCYHQSSTFMLLVFGLVSFPSSKKKNG